VTPTDEIVPASAGARNEPVKDAEVDRVTLAAKPSKPAELADAKKLSEAKVELNLEQESIRQRGAFADQPVPTVPAPAPSIQMKAKEIVSPGAPPAPQGPAVAPLASAPIQTQPPAERLSESVARENRPLSESRQQRPDGYVVSAPAPTSGIDASGRPLAYTESASPRQYFFRNLKATSQVPALAGAVPEPQRRRLDRADPAGTAGGTSVLVNFAIEQRGPSLRIIDGDGSVYEGRVLTNAEPVLGDELGKQVALKREEPAPTRNSVSETAAAGTSVDKDKDVARPQVAFEVFGTNKTLRQTLSLAGTLYFSSTNGWTETNIARFQQGLGVVTLFDRNSGVESKLQANPALPQVLRVRGLGRVNGSNEVPVDAVPAPR
jgi:hypothetical protein